MTPTFRSEAIADRFAGFEERRSDHGDAVSRTVDLLTFRVNRQGQAMSPTPSSDVRVAAAARLQFERLSPSEKRRLNHLLTNTDAATVEETRETHTGRFVSRLNAGKRVLWAMHDGRATVLSIVDGSYRPEP